MKKQYTRKQIIESIKYWQKQLNESTNDFIIRLIDADDIHNSTRREYKCTQNDFEVVLRNISLDYNICANDQFDDLAQDLKTANYVDCEEFGGDTWNLELVAIEN